MSTDPSHVRHILETIVAQTNGVARVRKLIDQGKVDGKLGREVIQEYILACIQAQADPPEPPQLP